MKISTRQKVIWRVFFIEAGRFESDEVIGITINSTEPLIAQLFFFGMIEII